MHQQPTVSGEEENMGFLEDVSNWLSCGYTHLCVYALQSNTSGSTRIIRRYPLASGGVFLTKYDGEVLGEEAELTLFHLQRAINNVLTSGYK
jgi:hypothetical protein